MLKQYNQKLRGSFGWEAKVLILEGPSVHEYMSQVVTAYNKCALVKKSKESESQYEYADQKALNLHT